MKSLKINISFGEIEQMSKWKFKKIVKDRVAKSALEYLIEQKKNQKKAKRLNYYNLKMQDYLVSGLCNKKMAKIIFKARTETLDLKSYKKWKFEDILCVACKEKEETGEEILKCKILNKENKDDYENILYDWFYTDEIEKLVVAGKLLQRNLQEREKIVGKCNRVLTVLVELLVI